MEIQDKQKLIERILCLLLELSGHHDNRVINNIFHYSDTFQSSGDNATEPIPIPIFIIYNLSIVTHH